MGGGDLGEERGLVGHLVEPARRLVPLDLAARLLILLGPVEALLTDVLPVATFFVGGVRKGGINCEGSRGRMHKGKGALARGFMGFQDHTIMEVNGGLLLLVNIEACLPHLPICFGSIDLESLSHFLLLDNVYACFIIER
jgi:hypothetical protein